MKLVSVFLFACELNEWVKPFLKSLPNGLLLSMEVAARPQLPPAQPCPGVCAAEWRPVCGLSAKKGLRTFSNVCMMSDWNRCNQGDYQVSKFSVC